MPKGDIVRLKADPEDGTVPVARLLLDALALCRLTALEFKAVLFLIRYTYGWTDRQGKRLKERAISRSDWASHLGLQVTDTANTRRLLAGLVDKKVIVRTPVPVAGGGYNYSINTHIIEWSDSAIDKEALLNIAVPISPPQVTHDPPGSPETRVTHDPRGVTQDLPRVSVTPPDISGTDQIQITPGGSPATQVGHPRPMLGGVGGGVFKSNIKSREIKGGVGGDGSSVNEKREPDPATLATFENIYQGAIGEVTTAISNWLTGVAAEYPEEWFRAAVEEARASTPTPNPGYIVSILERWRSAGGISGKRKKPEEVFRKYNFNLVTMQREEF